MFWANIYMNLDKTGLGWTNNFNEERSRAT